MKILYFANVAAQYRIPFYIELEKRAEIKFVITHQYKAKKIYNFGDDTNKIKNIVFLNKNLIIHYLKLIKILMGETYEYCMIPPLDSIKEMLDAYIIIILCKIKNKKCIYFWEKWQPEKTYIPVKKRIKNLFQKISFKIISNQIDKVLVPGPKGYRYFRDYLGYPVNKIFQVINTSSIQITNKRIDIREKYNIDKDSKIILYFGRIVRVKGLDILIKAYKELNDKNVCLLICGDGELKKEYSTLIDSKNVVFAGSIKSQDRYFYFKESDLFILPSRCDNGNIEAWGLTVAEAMEFDLPCIVSEMVGCSEGLIEHGVNGLVFKNESVDELSQYIKKLLEDESYRKEIIINAKSKIKTEYNYKRMSESFLSSFCG
jgi:glycosyltransferase involved in cell wall biosynthesis